MPPKRRWSREPAVPGLLPRGPLSPGFAHERRYYDGEQGLIIRTDVTEKEVVYQFQVGLPAGGLGAIWRDLPAQICAYLEAARVSDIPYWAGTLGGLHIRCWTTLREIAFGFQAERHPFRRVVLWQAEPEDTDAVEDPASDEDGPAIISVDWHNFTTRVV